MSIKVLVIDDEQEMRDLLATSLGSEEFSVKTLESGATIENDIFTFKPNIILMDYRLPGQSGVDLVKKVRANPESSRVPIIMVTGVTEEDEKVRALEMGADDYVVKPFLPRELTARIKAVFRRATTEAENKIDRISSGDLSIDFISHKVMLQNAEVALTLTEFRILSELMKQQGQVLSRDKLRQTALGNLNVTDRTIDVHMASLRKKLNNISASIQTVRGVGYRFSL
jgi:two-component system phosphate regulon response regulator PhoB